MLEVNNLSFSYQDIPILSEVSWNLPAGGLLHLQGANGRGKTTLLRLLAGLLSPESGQIIWQGRAIAEDLAAFQQHICYIGHKPGIHPLLSLRENLRYDLLAPADLSAMDTWLERFDLVDFADYLAVHLSAGQRRKIALIRLLLTPASLWLLDEPLVALDSRSQQILMQMIQDYRARGGIVVLTSHQSLPLSGASWQEYQL